MLFSKKTLVIVVLAGAVYALLNYHVIFFGSSVKLLKKSSMNMEYTFYNVKGKKPKSILAVDALRKDGIGDLLVEMGVITDEEKDTLMEEYGK